VSSGPAGRPVWLAALLATALTAQGQEGSRRGRPANDEPDRAAQVRGSQAADVAAQLADVQKRLKLKPDQQTAWDAYVHRVEALMDDLMRGVPAQGEHESAPRQINQRVDLIRNRLAAMEDIADAASHLYATLSEDQRETADELLPATVPTLYSGLPDLPRRAPPAEPNLRGRRP
jgi:phytoene dehydrogenase-like protein